MVYQLRCDSCDRIITQERYLEILVFSKSGASLKSGVHCVEDVEKNGDVFIRRFLRGAWERVQFNWQEAY